MIFGRQHADRARGFGHAIDLNELGAEYIHALAQKLKWNGCRTVENIFEAAVIDAAASWMVDHHLKSRGNYEKPRRPALFNRIKDRVRRKFSLDKPRQA